jgi:hypothetical protein
MYALARHAISRGANRGNASGYPLLNPAARRPIGPSYVIRISALGTRHPILRNTEDGRPRRDVLAELDRAFAGGLPLPITTRIFAGYELVRKRGTRRLPGGGLPDGKLLRSLQKRPEWLEPHFSALHPERHYLRGIFTTLCAFKLGSTVENSRPRPIPPSLESLESALQPSGPPPVAGFARSRPPGSTEVQRAEQ